LIKMPEEQKEKVVLVGKPIPDEVFSRILDKVMLENREVLLKLAKH